jgi:hypothetical protein
MQRSFTQESFIPADVWSDEGARRAAKRDAWDQLEAYMLRKGYVPSSAPRGEAADATLPIAGTPAKLLTLTIDGVTRER